LICSNCNKETKGIKLNGKIFCSFCGEIIKDPTEILEEAYQHTPENKETIGLQKKSSENSIPEGMIPKILNPDSENEANTHKEPGEKEVQLLEAEEEIIDLIAKKSSVKKSSIKIGSKTIKKHGRTRTDAQDFELVPNEPDPIAQPELEPPTDSLISDHEEEQEAEVGSAKEESPKPQASIPKKPKKHNPKAIADESKETLLDESKRKRQKIFTDYLRQTSGVSQNNATGKKQTNDSKSKSRQAIWMLMILLIIFIGACAAVYYVGFAKETIF